MRPTLFLGTVLSLLATIQHHDVHALTLMVPSTMHNRRVHQYHHYRIRPLMSILNNNVGDDNNDESSAGIMNDEELLQTVTKTQLKDLCKQLGLATTDGTKEILLQRLRTHANEQASVEQQRRQDRITRVEQGTGTEARERYEIVDSDVQQYYTPESDNDNEDNEDEEGLFFFHLPTKEDDDKTEQKSNTNVEQKHKPPPVYQTQQDVLTAPPPPMECNENGERVVTIYNTADQNDLTGVAASQPGQAAQSNMDPMIAGSSASSQQPQPWDIDQQTKTKKASSQELEQAKETVTELVQTLLAMSGAPAFRHFDMPENLEDINANSNQDSDDATYSTTTTSNGRDVASSSTPYDEPFVGFDPTNVPTHLLSEASSAIRANRGKVLQEVLREFELHAVGHDGIHGDDVEKGGGHFREVAKVRAFLEGFRRAQVRKTARETVTMLLDKLVSEGIEGLDISLSSMTRSSDDSDSTNDLNDSLINYLNDVIREQEKRVDHILAKEAKDPTSSSNYNPLALEQPENIEDDPIARLWNRTMEDGEQIESIDPNDPKVQKVLQEEAAKAEEETVDLTSSSAIPETAPEKLLLLLSLLRERIKTEAAFVNDERSRNLRTLAYCIRCPTESAREELILRDVGSSIDRMDSFLELVASSIEYAESTVQQLQPARGSRLNVKQLRGIYDQAESLREQQAWKAGGLKP